MGFRHLYILLFLVTVTGSLMLYRARMKEYVREWDSQRQLDPSKTQVFWMKGVEARAFELGKLTSVVRAGEIRWLENGEFSVTGGLEYWGFSKENGELRVTTWSARGQAIKQEKEELLPLNDAVDFNHIEFPDEVKARRSNGNHIITRQLRYDAETKIAETHSGVRLEGSKHFLEADHGMINLGTDGVELWGRVNGSIVPTRDALRDFLFSK